MSKLPGLKTRLFFLAPERLKFSRYKVFTAKRQYSDFHLWVLSLWSKDGPPEEWVNCNINSQNIKCFHSLTLSLFPKGVFGLPFYLSKRHPILIWLWHITDDSLKGERERELVCQRACGRQREGQKKTWVFTVILAFLWCPSTKSQQGRFLQLFFTT